MRRMVRSPFAGVLALCLVMIAVPLLTGNNFYLRLAGLVWTMGLAAVGLNILMGEAGQVSLGHAAFIGVGSYATAMAPAHLHWHPLAGALAGLVLSCAAASLIGGRILKLKGYYLSVATMALGYLVSLFIVSEPALTGGPDGMSVPRITLFGARLASASAWYWISAALLIIGAILAQNLKASPSGRAFRALHDSEVAAGALGVNVARQKQIAFVIAAGYASLAGSELALMNGFASPVSAGFLQSIELVTMVVIGGAGNVIGAIVGAATLVLLPQLMAAFQDYETLLVGLIIIAFMIFLRRGIVPTLAGFLGAGR